ncbi:MAG: hypothetical protein FD189_19 [Elusimicrobia bacterium]|nr:MAG: hypothetical protein FD154_171 [Elusimicrobiota bacterium]KAF0158377.1 MAG: hypothetical protein FD189_19 [Elusimicrobiota bacterium]
MKKPELLNKGVGSAAISLAAALLLAPALMAAVTVGSSRALSRLVTPNGDSRNDTFVFQCHNPSELLVKGEIFDLKGRKVADMTLKEISLTDSYYKMEWNPNLGMRAAGGVYIYQITVGETVIKGTVVVIR